MSKSREVIDYVKQLRGLKVELEDLATQSKPEFALVSENELRIRIQALERLKTNLQTVYSKVVHSDTDSLLLSRVLVSGGQLCNEIEGLRQILSAQHPNPAVLALQSKVNWLELDILRMEFELEERGSTPLLDKLMAGTALASGKAPDPLEVGSLLDQRYLVESCMVSGPSSAIYLVSDQRTPQVWAVKELWTADGMLTDAQVQTLDIEVRRLSGLRHEVLPRIVDAFVENGRYFVVLDALEGSTLKDVISNVGVLPLEKALGLCAQLAESVRYLHSQDLPFVLKDLSTSHVILDQAGKPKLISFGLSRLLGARVHEDGRYLTPEEMSGGVVDTRSDIFALGVLMHEVLTGQVRNSAKEALLPASFLRPELSTSLEALIKSCTAELPADRPDSLEQVVASLRNELTAMRAPVIQESARAVETVEASVQEVSTGRNGSHSGGSRSPLGSLVRSVRRVVEKISVGV